MVEKQVAKKGYWLAFAGAIVGSFVAFYGSLILFLVIGFLAIDRLPPGSGFAMAGVAVWGQLLAVPIGCAVGIAAALAIGQREAPLLTGVFSIPITVLVLFAVWGLAQIVDTMGYGWLIIIPPFIIPFLARWAALWAKA